MLTHQKLPINGIFTHPVRDDIPFPAFVVDVEVITSPKWEGWINGQEIWCQVGIAHQGKAEGLEAVINVSPHIFRIIAESNGDTLVMIQPGVFPDDVQTV